MEYYTTNVVKRHSDNSYIDLHLQPVKSIKSALRFKYEEDFEKFINGFYGSDNPSDYYLQQIKISYEEV